MAGECARTWRTSSSASLTPSAASSGGSLASVAGARSADAGCTAEAHSLSRSSSARTWLSAVLAYAAASSAASPSTR